MSTSEQNQIGHLETRVNEERAIAQTWLGHLRETVDALAVKSVELVAAKEEIAKLKRESELFDPHIKTWPLMREALGVAAEALCLPTSPKGKRKALAVVRAAIAKADGRPA